MSTKRIEKLVGKRLRKIVRGASPADLIDLAKEFHEKGDYQEEVSLLSLLLFEPFRSTSSKEQKLSIYDALITAEDAQGHTSKAIIYFTAKLELLGELNGKQNVEYAISSKDLAMKCVNMQNLSEGRRFICEAIEIMKALEQESHEEYPKMLFVLSSIEQREGNWAEAFRTCKEIGEVVSGPTAKDVYFGVRSIMSDCLCNMDLWKEALEASDEDEVTIEKMFGKESPEFYLVIENRGLIYAHLKAYEKALPFLERAKAGCPPDHRKFGEIVKSLEAVQKAAQDNHREDIDVEHNFRMCSTCEKISDEMQLCDACCKSWYCDKDCQLKDWENHRPACSVCLQCEIPLDRDSIFLRCSVCKSAKYCGVDCQKVDWAEHKKHCKK